MPQAVLPPPSPARLKALEHQEEKAELLSPGTGGKHQGDASQNDCQRSHQNGTQAQTRGSQRSLHQALAELHLQIGEFHDEDGVLGRQTHQHHQTDLRVELSLIHI